MRGLATLCFVVVAAAASAQSVTFDRQPSLPGDAIDQRVQVVMELDQRGRRGADVLEENHVESNRQQLRRVTATEVREGRVAAARVEFFQSNTARDGQSADDPVLGKTYLCTRQGEALKITTPDGQTPPIAEFALVAEAMSTLGTANPLAEFLAGRTVAIGEKIELPREVARRALGFESRFGVVDRFVLTLAEARDGIARFDAEIEAAGYEGQQMRLLASGAFTIETATCRVTSADLSGPVAMSMTVGDLTVDARGKLRLAIASRYYDGQR